MDTPRTQSSTTRTKSSIAGMDAWRDRASGTALVQLSNLFLNPTATSAWSQPNIFTHGPRLADAPPKHIAEVQQPLHELWEDYESMAPSERTDASITMSRTTSFATVATSSRKLSDTVPSLLSHAGWSDSSDASDSGAVDDAPQSSCAILSPKPCPETSLAAWSSNKLQDTDKWWIPEVGLVTLNSVDMSTVEDDAVSDALQSSATSDVSRSRTGTPEMMARTFASDTDGMSQCKFTSAQPFTFFPLFAH